MDFNQFNWKINWKLSLVMIVGGILNGLGVVDCILAFDTMDLNQIARGLTIFSAGLTIIVVVDTANTQKISENLQRESLARLERLESQLTTIQQSHHMSEEQFDEIKRLLQRGEKDTDNSEPK